MRLRIELRPYALPLARPWLSAAHGIVERRGWLVVAKADGISGFGDCAPLPESGTETADLAAQRLSDWEERAGRVDPEGLLAELLTLWPSPRPAADAAVETALLDLVARCRGKPLHELLAGTGHPAARAAVNAALGPLDEHAGESAADALAAGFRVLKLKVGIGPPREEIERIRGLAAALPAGVRLRLDANRAWDPQTARIVISALADVPPESIDSIEEPLRIPDIEILRQLQRDTRIALALDESLAERALIAALERLPVRRLVLKPAVIGGLRPTLSLARRARAAGKEVVLTSVVESAAGLWATAQLAAAIGGELAHGLDTARWLAEDLGEPPIPAGGWIRLPAGAGSGFMPFGDGERGIRSANERE